MFQALALDFRYSLRGLRRAPGFAAASIATIALGTGATAAVFAVVSAVLVRPLPYLDAARIALVWRVDPHGTRTWLSPPELDDLQRRATTFEHVAGLSDLRFSLTGRGAPEELQVVAASASLFPMLGVAPAAGRLLTDEDDREHAARVAVLSHGLWQRRFAGAASAVGSTILLDGRPYLVAGVLPAGFSLPPPSSVFPARADAWVALGPHLPSRARDVRYLHAIGKIRAGISIAAARDEAASIGRAVSREYASSYAGAVWGFDVVRMQDDVVRAMRPALLTLLAVVMLVLSIACANVAALMLARGESRRREIAVRAALGATSSRLVRQLLTEGLVLAALGGAGGLALAAFAIEATRLPPLASLPRFDEVSLDWRVLLFAAAASLGTALVFALAPALGLRGGTPAAASSGARLTRSTRSSTTGRILAGLEIALASLALVIALLLASRFARMLEVNPGFSPEGVVAMRVSLVPKYRDPGAIARYYEAAIDRARAVPGIVSAAAVTQLPLSGAQLGSTITVPRAAATGDDDRVDVDLRGMTPDYLATLRIPLLAGRALSRADGAAAPRVALVDETLARRLAATGPVIGRQIRWIRRPDEGIEVVGVVGAVRHRGVEDAPRETVYRPYAQYSRNTMFVAARAAPAGAAADAARAVAAAVQQVDPDQPVAEIQTLDDLRARSLAKPGFGAALGGTLAALALGMTSVGVFGLFAFSVAQRRREMGLRLAIGATPRDLLRLVLGDAMTVAAIGTVIGLAGGLAAARIIRAVLPGPLAADPVVLAIAGSVTLAAALAACWMPAWRAATLDPADVLRSE